MRHGFAFFLTFAFVLSTQAQENSWEFQWQKGQILFYKAQHTTSVVDVVDGKKGETTSQITVVKRWHVVDMDAQGIATLDMSITSIRHEQKKADGKILLFDSSDLVNSTPELRELKNFLGKTVTLVRLDRQGRIHEVKQGSRAKLESDPPFVLVLPGSSSPSEGQSWVRNYKITLEPPQGTGEQFEAQQKYTCAKLEGPLATLILSTELKTQPQTLQEKLPLMQKEVNGQVRFDLKRGLLLSVEVNAEKTIENHQGKNSQYTYRSTFTEQLLPPNDPAIVQTGGTR